NALFIGCGLGRIALDFLDTFEKIYATDKSFSMIWHLQQLLKGNAIEFYCPNEKNIHKLTNVAEKYIATIPQKKLNEINGRFNSFVSDVLNTPFDSNSLNTIFSIYFTDVIALKLWFNEVDKKLTENGLFIHFGPLDY